MAPELVLPWPDRVLHPNARPHWAVKAKAVKRARADARIFALAAGWDGSKLPDGPLYVWIDGYPADHRRRDADGLLSSAKPWLDGIADALGIDDRRFVLCTRIRDEVRKGGEVTVRITGEQMQPINAGVMT